MLDYTRSGNTQVFRKRLAVDDLPKPLILLVDDHPTNLHLLEALLERQYRTENAKDGQSALEFVKSQKPDLMLLDVMMPEMDGFEVCKRLQADPETRDIPVIFLTARAEGEDVTKGFEVGAVDYVIKPFRREELLARVKNHIKLKQAETFLKQGLAEAQHIAHMGSWVWDVQENTLTWSDEIYRIFGLNSEDIELTYEVFLDFVHPDDRTFVIQSTSKALYHQQPYSLDHRIMLPDGSERVVHEEGKVSFDQTGTPVRMLGTIQDVTERKRVEAELRKLSMAIEESINIVFITDADGCIEYVNPMFERVTGYARVEVVGQTPGILSSGEIPKDKYRDLWAQIMEGKTWQGEFKNKKKSGGFYWVKGVISPIKNEGGDITHFLAIQEDISERKLVEQQARYLSTHDSITGLLNRERFIEKLSKLVQAKSRGSLILMDVDGIKLINEAYGHNMADEILKRMGELIHGMVDRDIDRRKYILGRLGEDEFALALSGKTGQDGLQLAEQVRKQVENATFTSESLRTTISAGVVECPTHGSTTRELLSRVDAAVFRAKNMGRNRCYLFSPEDKDIENVHSRLEKKERILRALEEGRFVPWFQPILDLKDGQTHHYEALARMHDGNGNVVLPGAFIATAEALGLIYEIDRTITAKVMACQAQFKQQGLELSFSMNLSGKHLGDNELLKFLQTTIDKTGADPGNLIFEITETTAIGDLKRAITFINALKDMGCRFALDDFGVGFTSFVYLREMAVDFLKIDGIFIRRLHERREDQGIVKAITTVARDMGISTIAEFVEYEETLRLLKNFGLDYAQGFLIGKPAPSPKIISMELKVR